MLQKLCTLNKKCKTSGCVILQAKMHRNRFVSCHVKQLQVNNFLAFEF